MAWEVTYLLPPLLLLLLLLTSGSCEEIELFLKHEGKRWSVTCKDTNEHTYQQKCWCRIKSKGDCEILVSSSREQAAPLLFSRLNYNDYFTITITVLTVEDSERYCCGSCQSSQFSVSKCRVFRVSQAPTPRTTRRTRKTTAWTSTSHPVTQSSQAQWKLILSLSILLAAFLLVGSTLLLFLCCRKARGRTGQGKDEPRISGDLPAQKGEDLQTDSAEDFRTISYSSLTHLHDLGPQHSIYVNIHSTPNSAPDPFLSVEYATIAGDQMTIPQVD